jgi:solute carrier family 27 fatty acid transporter 6
MFAFICLILVFQLFFPFELIKYDFQKDEPMRNEQDWCIRVKKGKTNI